MADFLDPEVPLEWLKRLWGVIHATPHLRWLLLTKRPEHAGERLRDLVIPPNAALGVSVESDPYLWRVERALTVPFAFHFVSAEPLLGPLTWWDMLSARGPYCHRYAPLTRVGWVILGGESGAAPRDCLRGWLEQGTVACEAKGVPCFVKQLGAAPRVEERGVRLPLRLADAKGGDPLEWPPWLRVQQFPWGSDGKTLWGRQAG